MTTTKENLKIQKNLAAITCEILMVNEKMAIQFVFADLVLFLETE